MDEEATSISAEGRVRSMEQCCGTCEYHKFENVNDGYVCVNSDSEYCADWTEYSDCCEEWEERDGL